MFNLYRILTSKQILGDLKGQSFVTLDGGRGAENWITAWIGSFLIVFYNDHLLSNWDGFG